MKILQFHEQNRVTETGAPLISIAKYVVRGFALAMLAALLFAAIVALVSITPDVYGATVALPYANHSGYTTTRVLVNPTDEAIKINVGFGVEHPIAPHSVERATWPHDGGGVEAFDSPEGLIAYAEIRNPLGSIIRIQPLAKLESDGTLEFLDLVSVADVDEGYDSFVYLSSNSGAAAVTVFALDARGGVLSSQELLVPAGGTIIPQLPAKAVKAYVTTGWRVGPYPTADVYACALVSRRGYGEQFAVAATSRAPSAAGEQSHAFNAFPDVVIVNYHAKLAESALPHHHKYVQVDPTDPCSNWICERPFCPEPYLVGECIDPNV